MEDTPFRESPKIKNLKSLEVNQNKPKEKICCQNTVSYFCNFCENTSIHGFKFFGENHRNVFEKIYWFLVLFGAVFGSGTLISKAYVKWNESPIVVTFAMTETPIWKIPFPAVTICPETNANTSLFNYTEVYLKYRSKHKTTEDEDDYFKLFSLVCNEKLEYINETETQFLDENQILKFYYSFADMDTNNCKWLGSEADCENFLSLLGTSEGWCQTFNMLNYHDVYNDVDDVYINRAKENTHLKLWTLESGYPSNAGLDTFPRRTMISGINGGFQIDLEQNDIDLDYLCTDLQGYKIALHHPAEEPDMDKYFRVPLDQVVVAAIKPSMITTADEIKKYKPEARFCYVPGEKVLNFYKHYSQQNCLAECMHNYTISKCGCSPFYNYVNNIKFCGAGSKNCIQKAKVEFLEQEVNSKLNNVKNNIKNECNCLPACTSIEFDAETSQTDWNWKRTYEINSNGNSQFDEDYKNMHKSRLVVYYKDLQFMTSQRHELYGIVDFLANCGGLLGLCCGFSFTSLMEIIYYITIRLVSNFNKFGSRYWSGSRERIDEEDEDV